MASTISSLAAKYNMSSQRPHSTPRTFPVVGFNAIRQDQLVEEETMPEYSSEHFYPVRLGEVFNNQFQTVAKLGYGSSSTIWLARDLRYHQYVALKIYIHNSVQHRELPFYKHLDKFLPSRHPGAKNVRKLFSSFEVIGPYGKHVALALQVSQMSIRDMDKVFMDGCGFPEGFVKGAIKELLEALDFLHTEVQCVHTAETTSDVHPGNLLLGTNDDSLFQKLEENEFSSPVPRKQLEERTIYLSRLMKPRAGPLLLSDFGEARLGPGPHAGDIMPIMYRAPETLLHIQWGCPVDIWSVGLTAWDLLEGKTLFSARKEDGSFSDGVHFAELVAALGPPPPELLNRHRNRALEYWDEHGNWSEFVPIPREKTLEAAETKLENNLKFLQFIRRALTWDPNARPTARQLLQDPWLTD
ncbi:protein kinase domain-containing protein [Colletotrichum graminicola M1.001]|uniref:non-specific serine/threonine protein kinase n=1 Tax=Colletotrichum graminicola (strain M1.001 / M2 / FGSC 10212) TaxID=645133 RepID=E3QB46_COLGM|nr:protein kinase domain-containing protein [Colletotrichum graminicola M1.001]EFQ28084.1 protein kinase domain-containing protein [Colletotrichum graminicola M1.001]